MTFVISIVGRPNVGKSTIFNKLTKTKDSLVSNIPGLTRDRKYGFIKWKKYNFCFIDTGGIKKNISNKIEKLIYFQSEIAINESNIVLLVVDYQSGPTEEDKKISKILKNKKKEIVVFINKIDNYIFEEKIKTWYSLGIKKIISIPNIKKANVNFIIKSIFLKIQYTRNESINLKNIIFSNKKLYLYKQNDKINNLKKPIKISIVGKQNVGKSTLFNCIIGEYRSITFNDPGTTRDNISFSIEKNGHSYIIDDTAGIKKKVNKFEKYEEYSIRKTFQSICTSEVILFVIDVNKEISDLDFTLINFILKVGKSIIIVINKWDSISKNSKRLIKKKINLQLKSIYFIDTQFVSAICKTGINSLFQSIKTTYKSYKKKISTSQLNKIIQQAIHEYKQHNFYKPKIKYVNIGGYNPLIIVIHGKNIANLPNFYKRYLKNYFYRSLKIIGIAIYLQFRDNRKNLLQKNKVKYR